MNIFGPTEVINVHIVGWKLKWAWWPVRSEHSKKWIWREPVYEGTVGYILDGQICKDICIYLTTDEYIFTTLRGDWDF